MATVLHRVIMQSTHTRQPQQHRVDESRAVELYSSVEQVDHDHDLGVGMQMPHSVKRTLGSRANQRHSDSVMTVS